MIDPAIIHDLQHAMVPPAPPFAVVREWRSPMAEEGERILGPILAEGEAQSKAWRAKIARLEASFPITRNLVWSDEELATLDATIRVGEHQIEYRTRNADRIRRKGMRINRRLAQTDLSAASMQKRHAERIDAMHYANVEALKEILVKLRAHRAHVDTRSGAEPGYVHRIWEPNQETLAAMKRARSGKLETVSLDDLRAAIFADD